jgi:hypothetical protein
MPYGGFHTVSLSGKEAINYQYYNPGIAYMSLFLIKSSIMP